MPIRTINMINIVAKYPSEFHEIADPLQECVNRVVIDVEVVVNQDIAETGQATTTSLRSRTTEATRLSSVCVSNSMTSQG